ncbi:right-handed parallel beta-helix repeat-containing protein [Thermococcus sp. 21S7]|uniref:right-handed parallel beta-helix repeat-containing protein n=1 Tax=Thermococcus sp. 21S7 TaxID=1638221 RepID=UPI00143C06F2|nr:right-handed parallel beta-helix repeat-containing protein [Thermococcus sp. 21S7]NJE60163.1 PGF-pre-PGF domain-containing protein [Thermococcus sp. 21S7]
MKKGTLFLIYLLISSYLNVGFVGVSHVVQAQGTYVFQDDFNDNSLDTSKWTEDVVGSGNSYTETNGEAQFVTFGHQGFENGHAFLRSSVFSVSNWSSVTFSGSWKFTDPGTAEMWFRIYDADSGKYIGVRYISWPSDKVTYDRPEGSITEYRTIPREYVAFRVVLYKDRFEYWEGGNLVKTIPTAGMGNTTSFQLVIGGWDYSSRYSHMYFDNITAEYESAAPPGEGIEVTIISPEEKVYDTATIDLNVTANKPVDEWRYSLNGGKNVTFEPNTTITAQNGENLLAVYALAGDETGMARVNFYVNASEKDKTPPGTVKNLAHEVGSNYIHWTWDNPEDEDFETALIYVDGKFEDETDEGEWWLDELSPGETHTIGILTRDYSGNVNTTWVNDTATTLTPAETVYVNESGWWYEDGKLNPSETPLQDGIENAVEGGTVVVLAGTYPESAEIDKPLTVETSENARVSGDGSEWANGRKPIFYVDSDNVTLRGFVIASSVSNIGVLVDGVENCTVENNTITITETEDSERYGIYLSYGGSNVVGNNDVSVSGFQGVGIYVYEEEGESYVHNNTVEVIGDSADGIEVFYTSARVYDNTVSIDGVSENAGYALYLYLAGDSFVDNNELTTNLSETNAWAIAVIGEFRGSLSGNLINGIQTEIVCPENCLVRGVSPGNRPAPQEGYGDVGEYLEIDADSWLHLGLYYDDSSLDGLVEDSLQIWRFSEDWTLDGTSGHHLDTNKNFVEANLTQFSVFAPLAQEENDVTPPVLTFVEPTPKDGSLIKDSRVVINVTSNENLSMATLEFDGANHTMLGSGKNWHYQMDVADGVHAFKVYGQDLAGNNGTSESRGFEVDTKAPEYSNVGQDAEGLTPGGEVHVHAFWSDPHLGSARLGTNATNGAAWEWVDETFFEGSEGWSNFTISTDGLEPGLYCWEIAGADRLGHENTTPMECFTVYAPPEIVSYSPESPVESHVGDTVEFSVTADQTVNVTWYLDGGVVKTEENVETSTYTNSEIGEGEHSVRAVVENPNGSVSQFWAWYVYPRPSLAVSFVEPTPENGAMLNVRRVIINVSSSLDLDDAVLEWNGVNESMSGSGRSWWALKENLTDGTYTFRVYGSADGVSNATEERTVEIDATAPEFIEYGQNRGAVTAGGDVEVFARWGDAHLDGAVLATNATFVDGAFVWSEVPLQIAEGWSNGTISTDENFAGRVFCWYIRANDTFGNENETPELCFRVIEPLRIVSFSPEAEEITLRENETTAFSIALNQVANVTWAVNGTIVLEEEGNGSTYTNSSLVIGLWNVSVRAKNGNGVAEHWWLMRVSPSENKPPEIRFIPPTPENGSLVGSCTMTIAVNASEELDKAVLEFDGTNFTMEGSGSVWSLTGKLCSSDGKHFFRVYGTDLGNSTGVSETRAVEVDSAPPVIRWVHANNMTRSEIGIFTAERLSNASFEINVTDKHPMSYQVYLNPEPGHLELLARRGRYRSGVPFGFPVRTDDVRADVYRVVVYDAALNHAEVILLVRVVDTRAPGPVENLDVSTNSSGFTATWRNPSNDDFERVELYLDPKEKENKKGERVIDWNSSRVANLSGEPGQEMRFSMNLEHGRHILYARTFDRYGNGGTPVEVRFTVPLPTFVLYYVEPTPGNGTVLPGEVQEVTVAVASSVQLKDCTLSLNGKNVPMNVTGTICRTRLNIIPGAKYNFSVSAVDVYWRRRETAVRTFSVERMCFVEGDRLKLNPPDEADSLRFQVNFTFVTNSLAKTYTYRASVMGVSVENAFEPDIEVVDFKDVKNDIEGPFGERVKRFYVVKGHFVADLWEIQDAVLKGVEEGKPVSLEITAVDDCGKQIKATGELTVCKNSEKPDLVLNMEDFYYRDEDVMMSAEVANGVQIREFHYSINGGSWVEFNGTANLTGLLRPGENFVSVRAASECGLRTGKTVKVFLGPPSEGDWIVNDSEECLGHEFSVNGGLVIQETGNLTLRGCKVHLNGGVQLDGALGVLDGSLIGNASEFSGEFGKMDVRDSTVENIGGGTFAEGTAVVRNSVLSGEFTFDFTELDVDSSSIDGGIKVFGTVGITNTTVTGGSGITLAGFNEGTIENVTVRDCAYGIHLINDNGKDMTFRNILVENPREAGLFMELSPGYWFREGVFTNLTVIGGEVIINGGSATFDRSRIEPGDGYAVLADAAGRRLTFKNSSVGGKGILARKLAILSLQDSNLTGDITGEVGWIKVQVSHGARASLREGAAENIHGSVWGVLSVVDYKLNGGDATVFGGGTLRVEDEDGIPATDPSDGDASVLRNMRIDEMSVEKEAHIVVLNARLENTTIVADSKWFLIRGSVVNGRLSLNTGDESLSGGLTETPAFGSTTDWYYTTEPLPENWYYSQDTTGMTESDAPFVAYSSTVPSGWGWGTILGEFATLYLKKTFTVEELPTEAVLIYSAVGTVEIYVNGRKVVDDQRVGGMSFSGMRLHGVPHSKSADVAPYLVPGRNLITVCVELPSTYPYQYLGAFRASLTLKSGLSAITDSVLNGEVSGYGTRALLARDEVHARLSFGYVSWVTISDSRVHGTVDGVGRIRLLNSELIGNGSGTGLKMTDYGVISVENSRIHGFGYGIMGASKVNVTESEIYDNDVGIRLRSAKILVKDSYVRDNGVGIEVCNITGRIENNVIYGNGVGIAVNAGENIYMRVNRLSMTHDTVVGNSLGIRFDGNYSSGYVSVTESLIQNNDLGLLLNSTLTPEVRLDSLVNYRDVLIESRFSPTLRDIDWGGTEPVMVLSYPEGFMYTYDGEVRDDYDILARNWKPVILLNSTEIGEDWGSSLLSASLRVYPLENGSVKGVVTLAGRAVSRDGLSKVVYSLERKGRVETLTEVNVGSETYDNYVLLDTQGMNLTGQGVLRFTAVDSTGKTLTGAVSVYFANAEIVIENVSVDNATNIYSLYQVSYESSDTSSWDTSLNRGRYANVTVVLRNTGLINGSARVVLDLPEYVERHTGRIEGLAYLPPNGSLALEFPVPIVEYDMGTLTWDVLPDELPDVGRFTAWVRLYDADNVLREEIPVKVGFTLGPVFEITYYTMYPYSRAYCESYPNFCHNSPPYDGDGDDTVEAAESHHFDLGYENVGDEDANVTKIMFKENIPERDKGTKALKSHSTEIYPDPLYLTHRRSYPLCTALIDVSQGSFNLLGSAPVGVGKMGMDLFIGWWLDLPPEVIPPVNFTGQYLTNAWFFYTGEDGRSYYTPSLNYKKQPVKALNKTFVPQTVKMNPIDLNVMAVKDGRTYVTMHNTNGNVYYDYFVQGSYGPGEGFRWYHFMPPDFTMKAIADNSLQPSKTIPHYRIMVGFRPSMTGNLLKWFASTLNAVLGVLGIDVPAETLTLALAHTLIKVVNLAETIDFQTDSESFESINASARRSEVDAALIASNETVIAPVGIDTFARLEENYGMDREYYVNLENLDELPVSQQAQVAGKFAKAIALDEDLQILLLETIIEVSDMDLYYNLAKIAKGVYSENPEEITGAGGAIGMAALKKALKEAAKEAVLEEVKKTSYYKSLTPEEQKAYKDKVGKGIGAVIAYSFDMSQFVTYVVLAPIPGIKTIYVLDPPGNFTVHPEESNVTVLGGGAVGVGRGSVSLSLGDVDVYRAAYVASTESLPIGALFNGTLLWMRTSVEGRRNGEMVGNVTITMRPTAESAGHLLAAFRDDSMVETLLGGYFAEKPLWNVSMDGGTVIITASGILNAQPYEEETSIEVFTNANVTLANVTRVGRYGNVIEIMPSFVPLNLTEFNVTGNASVGVSEDVITVVRGRVGTPEIDAAPLKLNRGERITLTVPAECAVEWRFDGETGRGIFVPTEGAEPGNHTLEVTCLIGNLSASRNFTVEIARPQAVVRKTSGALVEGSGFVVLEFGTDLQMISLVAPEELKGVVAVSQNPGGMVDGYLVYSTFNVTHPGNWSVENVTLYFRVPRKWFGENNVSPKELVLLRREGGWAEYRPVLEYGDGEYLHYHASVPALSVFAVAGKVKAGEQGTEETETMSEKPPETQSTTPSGGESGSSAVYYLAGALLLLLVAIYLYRRR